MPYQPSDITVEGVPLEVLRHFQVDVRNLNHIDRDKMTDIYNLVDGDMSEVSRIESKLGRRGGSRHDKIWKWLKVKRGINADTGAGSQIKEED